MAVITRNWTTGICIRGHDWTATADKGGKSVCIGYYRSLLKTKTGYKTVQGNGPHVALILLDAYVIPYGIPRYLLTYDGPQYVAKFFTPVCAYLEVKQIKTTVYQSQTNGQTESYHKIRIAKMRHYFAEQQEDWDEYVQHLTYAYNAQVH